MEEYTGSPEIKKIAATAFATKIDDLVKAGTPIFENDKDNKEFFSNQMAGPAIMLKMAGIKDQEIIDFAKAIEFAAKTLKHQKKESENKPTDINTRRLENLNKLTSGVNKVFDNILNNYIEDHTKEN